MGSRWQGDDRGNLEDVKHERWKQDVLDGGIDMKTNTLTEKESDLLILLHKWCAWTDKEITLSDEQYRTFLNVCEKKKDGAVDKNNHISNVDTERHRYSSRQIRHINTMKYA